MNIKQDRLDARSAAQAHATICPSMRKRAAPCASRSARWTYGDLVL